MPYLSRVVVLTALLPALLVIVACDSDSATAPPPPVEDTVLRVTVRAKSVDIIGSCDHDSPFEGSDYGEFVFSLAVVPSGSAPLSVWRDDRAFQQREHAIVGQELATFNRNVSRGEDFIVRFTGTEYDGLLGADPNFNGVTDDQEHHYRAGSWTSREGAITLYGKDGWATCRVRIEYRVGSEKVTT